MVTLFVEGGGGHAADCRKAFSDFLTHAGLSKKPRIMACGSRKEAYKAYCIALKNRQDAVLLVDSEGPVAPDAQAGEPETWQPWRHLKQRQEDGWDKPEGARDEDCHLMVQCMEYWLVADRETLKSFFGKEFKENALPAIGGPLESRSKKQVYDGLAQATKTCQTKGYHKGAHSFKLLAAIDPAKVVAASPWAARFVAHLKTKIDHPKIDRR
ncbi:hypothetical protein CKO38_15515 [Rhodospirillum rubrum]|uniref:DUF4276 family protein n=1 Tax=Rhodospirillum rubrum TaxID=1085 RepID=UPI0019067F80|nr:DUF4276 family protein [Rhodospirillum rubrum]MBK1665744.1 hypothetical protein [Rhodospirillum rubrum]MBK1678053.1 hypothetical protein [Rhodospirillum rubrum]